MSLKDYDIDVYSIIEKELERQTNHLEMIASENFTLPEVMEAMGSVFTNKYAEGYPYKRYYGGCEYADLVESWQSTGQKNFSGANSQTCNLIPEARRTVRCMSRF
jgi:glycine/serine hydroxymethyltransferase